MLSWRPYCSSLSWTLIESLSVSLILIISVQGLNRMIWRRGLIFEARIGYWETFCFTVYASRGKTSGKMISLFHLAIWWHNEKDNSWMASRVYWSKFENKESRDRIWERVKEVLMKKGRDHFTGRSWVWRRIRKGRLTINAALIRKEKLASWVNVWWEGEEMRDWLFLGCECKRERLAPLASKRS